MYPCRECVRTLPRTTSSAQRHQIRLNVGLSSRFCLLREVASSIVHDVRERRSLDETSPRDVDDELRRTACVRRCSCESRSVREAVILDLTRGWVSRNRESSFHSVTLRRGPCGLEVPAARRGYRGRLPSRFARCDECHFWLLAVVLRRWRAPCVIPCRVLRVAGEVHLQDRGRHEVREIRPDDNETARMRHRVTWDVV